MELENTPRMAGDYEIIHSLHIGEREVVVGENLSAAEGEMYMCAYCQQNVLFASYSEVLYSDNYAAIIETFGKRVTEQAICTSRKLLSPAVQGIPNKPLTAKDCTQLSHDDDLNNKVIVIRSDVLRREYRVATHQVKLCTGGFGASPHSRGSACYCVDLYSGEESRFERLDVLGILKPDQMPAWVKHHLELRQQEQRHKKKSPRGEER